MSPPIGASSSIHIGFGWPTAVPLTLPLPSVAMRLGPVPAGPVHSCVGAAGRFAAVCCVRGGVFRGMKSSSSSGGTHITDLTAVKEPPFRVSRFILRRVLFSRDMGGVKSCSRICWEKRETRLIAWSESASWTRMQNRKEESKTGRISKSD